MSTGFRIVKVAEYSTMPAGVAGRELEIGDDGVQRVRRIELAVETTGQLLVRLRLVGQRLPLLDDEPDDFGARRSAEQKHGGGDAECREEAPRMSDHSSVSLIVVVLTPDLKVRT